MGGASTSDVELVMGVQAGQLEAFEAMVERYESLVRAVSYSTIGRRDLCDDVAQETFLAAWQTISSVKDATKLRPWLCGIARNLGLRAEYPVYTDGGNGASDINVMSVGVVFRF